MTRKKSVKARGDGVGGIHPSQGKEKKWQELFCEESLSSGSRRREGKKGKGKGKERRESFFMPPRSGDEPWKEVPTNEAHIGNGACEY